MLMLIAERCRHAECRDSSQHVDAMHVTPMLYAHLHARPTTLITCYAYTQYYRFRDAADVDDVFRFWRLRADTAAAATMRALRFCAADAAPAPLLMPYDSADAMLPLIS